MRRKTEQDLRLRQIRLSRMLDAIDQAVFAVNQSREIAFCNQSFETLTSRQTQEMLGQPLVRLLATPGAVAARELLDGLGRMLDGDSAPKAFESVDIAAGGGGSLPCRVHGDRRSRRYFRGFQLHAAQNGSHVQCRPYRGYGHGQSPALRVVSVVSGGVYRNKPRAHEDAP